MNFSAIAFCHIRQTGIHTERQATRQAGRQAGGQAGRRAGKQTYRYSLFAPLCDYKSEAITMPWDCLGICENIGVNCIYMYTALCWSGFPRGYCVDYPSPCLSSFYVFLLDFCTSVFYFMASLLSAILLSIYPPIISRLFIESFH